VDAYYVNRVAQTTGEHEVHTKSCQFFPSSHTYLGRFASCHEAIEKAKTLYHEVDGCYWCSPDCHTR
jgi:hypothetical protein